MKISGKPARDTPPPAWRPSLHTAVGMLIHSRAPIFALTTALSCGLTAGLLVFQRAWLWGAAFTAIGAALGFWQARIDFYSPVLIVDGERATLYQEGDDESVFGLSDLTVVQGNLAIGLVVFATALLGIALGAIPLVSDLEASISLSLSPAVSYLSVIKQVRVQWGTTHITRMKPLKVQNWLRKMDAAPKTKGHVKAIMHRLYEKAMLWELVEWQRNPMELVEVKGISKRQKRPVILTVEQFYIVLALIPRAYRMMVLLAQCSGLRVEEVLAVEKPDIHFETLSMQVVRAVVHGRVKVVKTEYSEDELPHDPDFAMQLLDWFSESEEEARRAADEGVANTTASRLLFTSPVTGRHYHAAPIQQDYIRPAGCCLVACPKCEAGVGVWCLTDGPTPNGRRLPLHEERWEAAGKYNGIGWHTFRHTYRSWLDDTGAPMGVQQKLMRHAQISTTMNVYGNALMEAKREANSAVVRKVLRSA